MAKLSVKNIKQPSPSWMVAATTILVALAVYGPDAIASMPGSVSPNVQAWLKWTFERLAILMGVTALATKSKLVGSRDKDDR